MRLDVLGQDQHADARMPGADLMCGDNSLVGVRGGHADVDDRGVGPGRPHGSQQRCGVADLGCHVESRVREKAGDALPGEHDVVGYDYPHGISAVYSSPLVISLPPRAPVRSASATIGGIGPAPVTLTVTTSRSPRCATITVAWSAPARAASVSTSATAK